MTEQPALLTLNEVASILRVSKATVSKLVNNRVNGTPMLASIRLGRRVLIRRETLLDWISRRDSGHVCSLKASTI